MSKRLSWAERLERAKARGKFTPDDVRRADHWSSCAVGERHGWQWTTNSQRLYAETRLGVGFGIAVANQRIKSAAFIYDLIQKLPPVEAQP